MSYDEERRTRNFRTIMWAGNGKEFVVLARCVCENLRARVLAHKKWEKENKERNNTQTVFPKERDDEQSTYKNYVSHFDANFFYLFSNINEVDRDKTRVLNFQIAIFFFP